MTKLEYLLMYQKADLKKQQLENSLRTTESRQKLNKITKLLREQQATIQKLTEKLREEKFGPIDRESPEWKDINRRVKEHRRQMEEIRLMNKAKWRLIEREGLTEQQAHERILRTAMERRTGKRAVAAEIIASET